MKKLLAFIVGVCLLSSCAESYDYEKDGVEITASPYGFLTKENKDENVKYKLCTKNVILSVIFSETIIAPVVILGTEMYEPYEVIEK